MGQYNIVADSGFIKEIMTTVAALQPYILIAFKLEQSEKTLSYDWTFLKSQFDKSKLFKLLQKANICAIFVTCEVSKLDRSRLVNPTQQ